MPFWLLPAKGFRYDDAIMDMGRKHRVDERLLGLVNQNKSEHQEIATYFHPADNMTTEMLSVYFPVGFQILSTSHEQALKKIK